MYNNILIISDNLFLCSQFEKIISQDRFIDYNWNFSISPSTNLSDFEYNLTNPVEYVDLKNLNHLKNIINKFDLIFSIHCKQIFPSFLIENVKCINIHPGYNPINRGWYPQVFSILNDTIIGATIHEIDNEIDNGPIIAREEVLKSYCDDSESLYTKVLSKEIELLELNLENILMNNYSTVLPEFKGNLHLKKDFNKLLELDLSEQIKIGDLITRLRALTHGKYNNAYFKDPVTGNKIYVSINLTIVNNE